MITVLLNPAAGSGGQQPLESELAGLFRKNNTDATIQRLEAGRDPAESARAAAGSSALVVAAGGDGTVSAVASALAGTGIPLGVLPVGTLNHFAKDLGIPLNAADAVATIAAGHTVAIDVGRVNGRTFINNASIGLYPSIVTLRDELRRQGHSKLTAFVRATTRVVWSYRGVHVAIAANGTRWSGRTPFVFVGNNEYTVDGLNLGGRNTLMDGQLVAYVTPRMRARGLPLLLARAILGRGRRSGAFHGLSAQDVEISVSSASRLQVALDGEVTTMETPLRFSSDPLTLHVVCPRVGDR